MKQMLKNTLIPLILSSIFGFIAARLVFNIYQDDLNQRFSSSKIYLLQNGEYDTYEEMRKSNLGTSYVYYEDNNKYKSVIGITQTKENISKIKDIYTTDIVVEEYYIDKNLLNEQQTIYDQKLSSANNQEEVKNVVNNIINLYKEDKTIQLILTK